MVLQERRELAGRVRDEGHRGSISLPGDYLHRNRRLQRGRGERHRRRGGLRAADVVPEPRQARQVPERRNHGQLVRGGRADGQGERHIRELPEHVCGRRQLRAGARVHVHGAGSVRRNDERRFQRRCRQLDVCEVGGPRDVRERKLGGLRREPGRLRVDLDELPREQRDRRLLLPAFHGQRLAALHGPAEPRLEGRRVRGDGRRKCGAVCVRRHDERPTGPPHPGLVFDGSDGHDELGLGWPYRRELESNLAGDVLSEGRRANGERRQRIDDDGRFRQRRAHVVFDGRPLERARAVLAHHAGAESAGNDVHVFALGSAHGEHGRGQFRLCVRDERRGQRSHNRNLHDDVLGQRDDRHDLLVHPAFLGRGKTGLDSRAGPGPHGRQHDPRHALRGPDVHPGIHAVGDDGRQPHEPGRREPGERD